MDKLAERLVQVVPSERQLRWHELEFYSFIHFGINTFYNREWGNGKEDPAMFNPTELDTDQWIRSLKAAGIKAAILTCKHHDGFCLWPSKYTEHSVKNSPYKNGKGDIVKEMAESCKKYGLKFGVYLSPWDMHEESYGDSPRYNDYFINQLTELLTEYGGLFSVWFDGACGEGPNGKRQQYDWERYYSVIRKLQPEAVIAISGPDVRWCGNEAGHCRASEWNVVPKRLSLQNYVAERSQKEDDSSFREREVTQQDEDLGSREILKDEKEIIWYPSEVDTSIRPGWFYHEEEDDKVRSLESLLDIYYNSVGGNATLLLNVPPSKRGLIHENDAARLKEIGDYINKTFSNCITGSANITASSQEEDHTAENIKTEDINFYKAPNGEERVTLTFEYETEQSINHVVLRENLALSQRIEEFEIIAETSLGLKKIYEGTVVGSRKICVFDEVKTRKIILNILASRVSPTLRFVGIYTSNKGDGCN